MINLFKNFLYSNPYFKKYFGNDDRGSFRNRRLFYTIISALGAKGVNIFTTLLSVPLTYNYLNAERFGVLMSLVSLVASLGFADLGLSFGLQNRWADLSLDETGIKLKKAISSVFFFLLAVAILLTFVAFILYFSVDISSIFKSNSSNSSFVKEVNQSSLTFLLFTAVSFPFSIVQKIQTGKQEGYYTNIWSIFSNIIGLILLVLFTRLKLGIPAIIFALYGITNIFIVLNFIFEFQFNQKKLSPKLTFFDFKMLKYLIQDGSLFLLVQIGAITLNVTNNLFLASCLGAASVAEFNIGYKLITLFIIPLETALPYLTPALNDGFANNDSIWIKKVIIKVFKLSFVSSFLTWASIYFFGEKIIELWIGHIGTVNSSTIKAFSFFALIYASFGCVASFLMLTTKFIHFKTLFYLVAIVISTIIKYFIVKEYGIVGLLDTVTICMFSFFVIPSFIVIKKYLDGTKLLNL